MKAIKFPQANASLNTEGQEDQIPVFKNREGVIVSCFELSEEDLKKINESHKLWVATMTYNEQLQPTMVQLVSPFEAPEKAKHNDK